MTLQATCTGVAAGKITHDKYYKALVNAAKSLDNTDKNVCVPERKVRQAELVLPPPEDPKDFDDPKDTPVNFQIQASMIQELLEAGVEENNVIKILNCND